MSKPAAPATGAKTSKPLFTTVPLVRRAVSSDGEPNTGDFELDHASAKYTLEWESMQAFQDWRVRVQREEVVEWIQCRTGKGTGGRYDESFTFRCARGKVRGEKAYEKKHPEWKRKVPAKHDDCKAELTIRTYPGTESVLGHFKHAHSHDLGDANARFTRLSLDTRLRIAELLRTGVDPDRILKDIHSDALKNSNGHHTTRDAFVTRNDIRYIQKKIEAETTRLDKDDGTSAGLWVQRWFADGDVLSFKTCNAAPPVNSGLAQSSFHLIIQTEWQRERWREFGDSFAGIDGTHNTTCYENTTLFTIIVRDHWGHGIPVAWMLSSDGKQETLEYFLRQIRVQSPDVKPRRWMTDRDEAQINAVRKVYPESEVVYCWWHVLHAWQQHFVTTEFPELWSLLKAWIRIRDPYKFDEQWEAIQRAAPESFLQYLNSYWMSEAQQKMWSAVYRVDRHIFEEGDTNMLIEAWHHVLKGKFLDGKRNRRLDTLICILHDDVIRHYQLRYHRQLHGFEGPDLEAQERMQIAERAHEVPLGDVTHIVGSYYTVLSQSTEDLEYDVDVDESTCTCYAHTRIGHCKHLAAVAIHFPERVQAQSIDLRAATIPPPAQDDAAVPSRRADTLADDARALERVAAKMRRFLARAAVTTDPVPPSTLQELEDALDSAIRDMPDRGVLPTSVAVPPNIKTATETARKLPHVKTKRKAPPTWRQKEAYSGGERPGKKAKSDALHAPPPRRPSPAQPPIRAPSRQKENIPVHPVHPSAVPRHSSDVQERAPAISDAQPRPPVPQAPPLAFSQSNRAAAANIPLPTVSHAVYQYPHAAYPALQPQHGPSPPQNSTLDPRSSYPPHYTHPFPLYPVHHHIPHPPYGTPPAPSAHDPVNPARSYTHPHSASTHGPPYSQNGAYSSPTGFLPLPAPAQHYYHPPPPM